MTNKYQDPNPSQKFTPITERMTESEEFLVEKFEPLASDSVEQITGFIVRSTVDIARYKRSISRHPDKETHYRKLVKATQIQTNVRFNHFAQDNPDSVEDAIGTLASLDWSTINPRITSTVVPYSGTEPKYNVEFTPTPAINQHDLPA